MTASEASVISMHFAATPVEFDLGEGISAGFRCISFSVSVRNKVAVVILLLVMQVKQELRNSSSSSACLNVCSFDVRYSKNSGHKQCKIDGRFALLLHRVSAQSRTVHSRSHPPHRANALV